MQFVMRARARARVCMRVCKIDVGTNIIICVSVLVDASIVRLLVECVACDRAVFDRAWNCVVVTAGS